MTAIQLTRLTTAFGAISDLWFIILYTKAPRNQGEYTMLADLQSMPLGLALLASVLVAVGLFAYGASLNDILDVRHDAAFSPDRPLPAGRIRLGQAVVVTIGSLLLALLGSYWLGRRSFLVALLTAAVILFYNAAGKFIPAVGIVTIGLIHAAHMLIANPELTFTLPVWLIFTHVMVIAAMVHALEDKRPRLTRRAVIAIVFGWLTWSAVILGAGIMRENFWPAYASPAGILCPLLAATCFIVVSWWKTRRVKGAAAAEKLKRYGAMWQSLYGAAWLLALGMHAEAAFIFVVAVLGFTAMTLIKEVVGLTGRPIAYRA
jgi:4-hydroxybenzoate polyprenyltransferase